MPTSPSEPLKLALWAFLAAASILLRGCCGASCGINRPTVQQTQVGRGNPPKFTVEIRNNCQTCPAINIHIKCGNFSQALVNPKLFRVLAYDDCVVNSGLPLAPLQKLSFSYSHQKFLMSLRTWYFQCE
ncbi:uncharacterized protein At1g05835 [Magnolia sinica]|uniref:uncharacterized protein At1g05835 n=1 Tax=Magnolia sinica TaxID=86752 RepID=UPI00265A1243|nr:uncharacterized protein At1g05835 [Magnolia sinica]